MLSELNDMSFEEEKQPTGQRLYKTFKYQFNDDSLIDELVEDNKVDYSFSTYNMVETSYSENYSQDGQSSRPRHNRYY